MGTNNKGEAIRNSRHFSSENKTRPGMEKVMFRKTPCAAKTHNAYIHDLTIDKSENTYLDLCFLLPKRQLARVLKELH